MPDQLTNTTTLSNHPKTVVILGAGASHDLGIPLGNSLIDHIITNHRNINYTNAVRRIIYNNREDIRHQGMLDQLPPGIAKFINGNPELILRENDNNISSWTSDLHNVESIDQYLSYRKEISLLGKLSILLTLSQFENPEKFAEVASGKPEGPKWTVNRTWYNLLWNTIISNNPDLRQIKEILSQMHFVTFNYDRSLEAFLLKSIKAIYPNADIKSSDLPITHIYGSLGSLDPEAINYREYSKLDYRNLYMPSTNSKMEYSIDHQSHNAVPFKEMDQKIFQLALGIETYGKVFDSVKAQAIQHMIKMAEYTYVFGFSFHPQNMDILFSKEKADEGGTFAKGCIDGTCLEMSPKRMKSLRAHLFTYFQYSNDEYLSNNWRGLNLWDYFKGFPIEIPPAVSPRMDHGQ